MKKILVVAAHPDDEILGCGGTMARHSATGDSVQSLIMATGLAARAESDEPAPDAAMLQALWQSATEANLCVGAAAPIAGEFPDNQMDTVALLTLVKTVEAVVQQTAPDVIYTHHPADLNVDHMLTFRAVATACRPIAGQLCPDIYCFEVPSSTEWSASSDAERFAPTLFINIEDHLEAKLQALACYDSEMRPFPHPRSLEACKALAHWRGATAGFAAAEAFSVYRARIV